MDRISHDLLSRSAGNRRKRLTSSTLQMPGVEGSTLPQERDYSWLKHMPSHFGSQAEYYVEATRSSRSGRASRSATFAQAVSQQDQDDDMRTGQYGDELSRLKRGIELGSRLELISPTLISPASCLLLDPERSVTCAKPRTQVLKSVPSSSDVSGFGPHTAIALRRIWMTRHRILLHLERSRELWARVAWLSIERPSRTSWASLAAPLCLGDPTMR